MTVPIDRPLSARERAAVVARIQALIDFWDIREDELRSPDAASTPLAATPAVDAAVKYRHPVTGEHWDGVGAQPGWLRQALLQEGLRLDELRPSGAEGSSDPKP